MTPRKDVYGVLHLEPLAPSSPAKLHLLVARSGGGGTPPARNDSAEGHALICFDSYSWANVETTFLALE